MRRGQRRRGDGGEIVEETNELHFHTSTPLSRLWICNCVCTCACTCVCNSICTCENKLYFHMSTLLRHHNSKLPLSAVDSLFSIRPNFLTKLQTFTFATCARKKKKNLRPSVILIHFHLFWSLWWNAPFEPIIGEMTRNKSLAKCNKYGKMKQIIGKM